MRVIGFNDEQTDCDKCGRNDLRGTAIVVEDGAEIGRFGSSCVSSVVGGRWTQQKFAEVETRRNGEFAACINYGRRVLEQGHTDIAARQAARALEVALTEAERETARELLTAAA